ncbi:MAG: decaprenylphospho-beta-D-ribofuranose 2-oxidase [Planctomycetota bacterium]|jgi:decaprenylphospho-beta-D-ribofuranose 2-oxidase
MTSSERATTANPQSDYEYVEGWGMSVGNYNRVLRPTTVEEIVRCYEIARESGKPLTLRGTGCSYGDPSCNSEGHVLDMTRMNRILSFDKESGVIEVEAGASLEDMWKFLLPHGFWPKVCSGTMFPTAGGALGMNIHGKNNFKVGTWGDNTVEFDIVLPSGEVRTCDRENNADLFHAAIGGMGLLGTFSRAKLKTKRVHSGEIEVRGISTRTLRAMMDYIEEKKSSTDYLVGWIDCFATGDQLGRGLIHDARYLEPGEDADPEATLKLSHQELPSAILGVVPKDQVWRGLYIFGNDLGMRMVNLAKYHAGRVEQMQGPYRQSHAGFNFLLDFVPNWKWAYGRHHTHGLIQYQPFVPDESAHAVYTEILELCHAKGFTPYLGVLKRHKPDPFWLTHSLDGWSFALDFQVTPKNREALWKHCHEMTEIVLKAGGKFYFAKDLVLRAEDATRFYPEGCLDKFRALKQELDPEGLLQSDVWRRISPECSAQGRG